jgi:mxaD protein
MKNLLKLIATTLLVVPMIASAHGPSRQKVVESVVINAKPEKVWALVKDFGALEKWHPAVASTEMKDDKTRVLTLKGDGAPTITEELLNSDDAKMMVKYKITDMSVIKTIEFNSKDTPYFTLPVNNYKADITVKEDAAGTKVTWKAAFYRSFMDNPPVPEGQSDQDAVDAVKGVFKAGLENLKAISEK